MTNVFIERKNIDARQYFQHVMNLKRDESMTAWDAFVLGVEYVRQHEHVRIQAETVITNGRPPCFDCHGTGLASGRQACDPERYEGQNKCGCQK